MAGRWRCTSVTAPAAAGPRSSAHGANLFYKLDDFRWTRGEENVVDYKLPEAARFGAAFCGKCGGSTPRVALERRMVIVPAGPLDTDPGMRPMAHIFVESKATWFEITDSIPQFDGMPPRRRDSDAFLWGEPVAPTGRREWARSTSVCVARFCGDPPCSCPLSFRLTPTHRPEPRATEAVPTHGGRRGRPARASGESADSAGAGAR